ncbi:MAG: glutathione S-transferase family protein [Pseudomonadota bacterium]
MALEVQDNGDIAALVAAANSALPPSAQGVVIGGDGSVPRFELYHAGFSMCSNKVRCVLAEKRLPYTSHALRIGPVPGELQDNYLPDYVRLRLRARPDQGYARGYTGASSVTTEGFDPAVVPTLVDHDTGGVIADSRAICLYLDALSGEPSLVPAPFEDAIAGQIDLIDQAPHVALLYGGHPDQDTRPAKLIENITGVHAKKVAGLREALALVSDDPVLAEAYRAKIEKEEAAAAFIQDAPKMRAVHEAFAAHVAALEAQLALHDGPWAFGEAYTLADIMWTISLYRLILLGLGGLWGPESGNARVAAYMRHAPKRASFEEAVVNWRAGAKP